MTSTTTAAPHATRTLPIALELTPAGDPARLDAGVLSLLQYPATPAESGPAGVHLRVRPVGASAWEMTAPLTGPAVLGVRAADGTVQSAPAGLAATARLAAAGEGWAWSVTVRNDRGSAVEVDLLHTLDAALTPRDAVRRNEQYVAQYLDLTPVRHGADGAGLALAVRQNMPAGEVPWAVIGADAPVAQWGTDALQLLDQRTGAGLDPARDLPSERLQHEHTLAALRTAVVSLAPGESWSTVFWGAVVADHPAATTEADAALVDALRERVLDGEGAAEAVAPAAENTDVPRSLLATAAELPVREAIRIDLEALAGGALRLLEEDRGAVLSAFGPAGHVVAAAKERAVLRPHGHVQQVHARAAADLDVVASTAWMRGVFCSQLTIGHASSGELTGVRRSYLGLERASGVRLLRRAEGGDWQLLGLPTAWSVGEEVCTWLYVAADGVAADGEATVRVRAEVALPGTVRLTVTTTGAVGELLLLVDGSEELSLQAAADGQSLEITDDSALFSDAVARDSRLRTVALGAAREAEVLLGRAGADAEVEPYRPRLPRLTAASAAPSAAGDPATAATDTTAPSAAAELEVAAVGETLAWLAQNASVHFRSPRGLEQYTGGAWGTRDVCQGPVGLLLATDEPAELRRTLLTVLGAQQEDGTWPQWFDYLPGYAGPGLRDAHGDVVYWPLLALAEYLEVTGDASILAETAGWVGADRLGEPTSVLDHALRAVEHISRQRTEDPRLPAYGHGDWNDSLQPASPALAASLCSTWTTELEIKALGHLAAALGTHANPSADPEVAALAARCQDLADGAAEAFAELLLVDGELAGYAHLRDGEVRHLVHPRDETTGLQRGSLQVIHALADELLAPEQARHHLDLLEAHLTGPTGIHLFDRPVGYHGGVMEVFQRAETATFFGREIGLMYMHAHLRYVEALTRLGEPERAWTELLKAVPIGLSDRVDSARIRQSTCYFSSSDAVFPDRATAAAEGARMREGTVDFEGGWRVYSSGPGLLLRMIVEDLLGLRARAGRLEVDPVLPGALDGAEAEIPYDGGLLTVRFRRGETGCGVRELRVDGEAMDLAAARALERRYRAAGVGLDRALVRPGAVLEVVTG
ncbi:GH36-type glycosyl hydrolase domain-containing protein [Brachybacterium sp. J153]|uniref:GH36-type glycosyl hydrolase domain-containing protein n=1 Tax=Brachybacterium sp. J153 TaxID=3116488 RepID=UPI002E7811DD|nr:cellobiose phosphorylase [Brachybacterium sp. J153]MEE1618596.1 cellobiose phosphorylase [Brachybacterium sp. J153]